mgnify:CR=1 FL=1
MNKKELINWLNPDKIVKEPDEKHFEEVKKVWKSYNNYENFKAYEKYYKVIVMTIRKTSNNI